MKCSAKDRSKLDLRDLTENDQEDFYTKLSNELDYRPNILSVHHKFNEPFVPVSQRVQLPPTITSLFEPTKTKLSYDELVVAAENVKSSYSVTDEESRNLEEVTRLQARYKLWEVHRAGRVTASNLRATVHTDANNPSKSLIKRICYPEACKFVSTATAWGCQQEVDGIQDFLDGFFLEHSDVKFESCGLVVNPKYLFMGASSKWLYPVLLPWKESG